MFHVCYTLLIQNYTISHCSHSRIGSSFTFVWLKYGNIHAKLCSVSIFQIRKDSSLVPLRRLSSDKARKFVYPDFPAPRPVQDSPVLPQKSLQERTDRSMNEDDVL